MFILFIKKTNGDALGVLLFILLIAYFSLKKDPTTYEYGLLVACCIAFIVDLIIVIKAMSIQKE